MTCVSVTVDRLNVPGQLTEGQLGRDGSRGRIGDYRTTWAGVGAEDTSEPN